MKEIAIEFCTSSYTLLQTKMFCTYENYSNFLTFTGDLPYTHCWSAFTGLLSFHLVLGNGSCQWVCVFFVFCFSLFVP